MIKKFRNKKGAILAEAIVSVAVLVAGIIAMSTIITNAVSSTKVAKDYLVAQNLITEAVEVVKVVRDTNWMRYPRHKECWLLADPNRAGVNPGQDCLVNQFPSLVVNSNYLVMNPSGVWQLFSPGFGDLNLPNGGSMYKLYIDGNKQYVHSWEMPAASASKFYRVVKVLEVSDTRALLEAKVQWLDGSKVREIVRKFTIFNYL